MSIISESENIATMTANHHEHILREREEARADAAQLADRLSGLELRTTEELARLERERDEALEQNAKLLSIAERAIDDLRWFYESKADGIILELNQLKEGAE